MLDIYEEFEKRNNKNSYESEVNDLLSWLWENIDDSKINCDESVYHDNFKNYIESEKIDCDEIIENIVNGKDKIIKETMFYNETAAQNLIMELLENAYNAGVEAAENELNQRISEYNENLDRIKQEIEEFSTTTETSTADLMQTLYSDIDNMNLLKDNKPYYLIQGRSKYTSDYLEQGKKAYTKKEVNSIVRKMKKEFFAVRVLEIKNGKETVINEYIKEAA